MEKKEWIDKCYVVFDKLVKETLWSDFKLERRGLNERYISSCYDKLSKQYTISSECLVDFCVCQVSTMTTHDKNYKKMWNISHSFGDKAIYRYSIYDNRRRYYDDRWLVCNGLSRQKLMSLVDIKNEHPLSKYIYPEYEEHTKYINHSSEIGYIICGTSTFMWTPFSPICTNCTKAELCKERTKHVFPHLYIMRCQAWDKQQRG